MYSQELKAYTAKEHLELEQKLIPMIKDVKNVSQYAALLKLFFGFYAPLEKKLSDVVDLKNVITGMQLRKAESLKNDIIAIQSPVENVLLCDDLPGVVNLSSALGILYVLEGSTLGGKGIAGILKKNLATEAAIPFSFFLYYGDDTKKMWDRFKDKLDSTSNLSKDDLLSAASETFILFKRWIQKNNSSTVA